MPYALLFCLLGAPGPEPIVIDGRFDDWTDVPVTLTDPADAREAPVDFGELRVDHDERFVHLLIDFGRVVNLQHLHGTARILLDTDGNARTGRPLADLPGVDAIVELTPPDPEGRRGRGAGLRVVGDVRPRSAYAVGLAFGPTYASRHFELRLDRRAVVAGLPRFLVGGRFSGQLEFVDREGTVADRTEPFAYQLSPAEPSPGDQASDPLARPAGTDLRVVTWNVNFGAVLIEPEPFGRVLRAVDADVVLLQEIPEGTTPLQLVEFARRWMPSARWNALLGAGGGDLRCAVLTHLDLEPAAALRLVPFPDLPDQEIRVAAAVVGAERRLLVLSVHLRCCGWAGGYEDRTRQVEADTLRRAIAKARPALAPDGLVIAGDLNLVGSRRPLELLAEGLDVDGTALAVAETLQLDGRSNATWGDPDLPFVPGRLDYLLHTEISLGLLGAFALETRDLEPRWLEHYGLDPDDTTAASDHLPIVADLRWTGAAR